MPRNGLSDTASQMPGSPWKEKLSLPLTQTSGISDSGRCLHTEVGKKGRSEKSEWNGQLEESVFRVTNELGVYRQKDVLFSHPPWLFTQKARNRPKRSFSPVKEMLIYSQDWFQSTCPKSCQQQGSHKRGFNWGMAPWSNATEWLQLVSHCGRGWLCSPYLKKAS